MSEKIKNLPASIHQRLKNEAELAGRPFQEFLYYYSIERFLVRLSQSHYKDKFILKGGLMFSGWEIPLRRPTRDIDVQGKFSATVTDLVAILREICTLEIEPDGMSYDPESVRGEQIMETMIYPGVRIDFMGYLGNARLKLHMDVSFANIITPAEREFDFPTLLGMPRFHLLGYPIETTIAEKLQAMVALDIINGRMKDFYDIWLLSENVDIQGLTLVDAIQATFTTRRTKLPENLPTALSDEFIFMRQNNWNAFLRRSLLTGEDAPNFQKTIERLRQFLVPILDAAYRNIPYNFIWKAGISWQVVKPDFS